MQYFYCIILFLLLFIKLKLSKIKRLYALSGYYIQSFYIKSNVKILFNYLKYYSLDSISAFNSLANSLAFSASSFISLSNSLLIAFPNLAASFSSSL